MQGCMAKIVLVESNNNAFGMTLFLIQKCRCSGFDCKYFHYFHSQSERDRESVADATATIDSVITAGRTVNGLRMHANS